jgi:ankyrin repeat protein
MAKKKSTKKKTPKKKKKKSTKKPAAKKKSAKRKKAKKKSAKKKSAKKKTTQKKSDRPLLPRPKVNPFTGEPMDFPEARDWGDVSNMVLNGKVDELRELFEEGMTFQEFQINYNPDGDRDYLHVAAENGDLEMVKLLVEQGADTGEPHSEYWTTALEIAVDHKKKNVVEYLVDRTESAEARKRGWEFLSPKPKKRRKARPIDKKLRKAIWSGSVREVTALLKEGADPNSAYYYDDTIIETPLSVAAEFDNLEIAKRLIEAGADVNLAYTESDTETPICKAVRDSSMDFVGLLLSHGAEVNICDRHGRTCLMWACATGLVDKVDALLEAGADPHAVDKEGRTAMHYGLKCGERAFREIRSDGNRRVPDDMLNAKVTIRLVEAGADFRAMKKSGYTKLMLACPVSMEPHSELECYQDYKVELVKAGVLNPRSDELVLAILENDQKKVRKLLKAGVNVNHRGDAPPRAFQVSPLFAAVGYRHLDLARLLLKTGADPDARSKRLNRFSRDPSDGDIGGTVDNAIPDESYTNETPLRGAVECNEPELIQLLTAAGADLHLDDPLILAIHRKHVAAVRTLLDAGINPHEVYDRSLGKKGIDAVTYANQPSMPKQLTNLVNAAAKRFT